MVIRTLMKHRTLHFGGKHLSMLLCAAAIIVGVHGLGRAVSPIVTVTTDTLDTDGATVLTETVPGATNGPKESDNHSGDEFRFVSARRDRPIRIHFDIRRPADKHDFAVFDQNGRQLIDVIVPPMPDKTYVFTFHEEGLFDFKCLTHPSRLIGQFTVLPSKSAKP